MIEVQNKFELKEHGKNMERTWKEHGKNMERTWIEHG
jgi:hypothetical protein